MSEGARNSQRATIAVAVLLVVAFVQRAWTGYATPPLTGYDAPGHAGYMFTILAEAKLPHPYDGWSTFHPPLYHLVGSAVWAALDSLNPRWLVAGIRLVSVVAGVAAGWAGYRALVFLGYSAPIAWMATALLLFVPVSQLSGTMIGNEAFAAGIVALALPGVLALQRDPANVRRAAIVGVLAGLALCTKYTSGGFVLIAAAIPFLRIGLDRRAYVAGACCLALAGAVAAPVYVRNVVVSGTPIPLTRNREPMKESEEVLKIRDRELVDFLWIPPGAILRPSLYHEVDKMGSFNNRNPAMTSVWGLTYATMWFDAFGHRTSVRDHRDEKWAGAVLALLGLLPTLAMVAGFGLAWADLIRRRGRSPDAPLVVMATAGFALFTAIAIGAPSAAALKSSYLLSLGVPAAVFFARAAARLSGHARTALLAVSAVAVLAAGLYFTAGLFFPPMPMGARSWMLIDAELPNSYILEAMERLLVGWYTP